MNEKEEKMGEIEWVEQIKDILNERFEKSNPALHAKTQVEIPYGIKIKEFNIEDISKKKEHWKLTHNSESEDTFAADLLIYEEKDGNIIPRVVMEAKYRQFSTHDAITYGKKAVLHKSLMPTLRYGMILGAMEDKGLAGRLFEHGGDFDFMFSFKDEKPVEGEELESFFELVDSEIESSENLKEMFDSKNKKADYYCLQRKLILK